MGMGDLILDCLVQCLGLIGGRCYEEVRKQQSMPPVAQYHPPQPVHPVTPAPPPPGAGTLLRDQFAAPAQSSSSYSSSRPASSITQTRTSYPATTAAPPAARPASPPHTARPAASNQVIDVRPQAQDYDWGFPTDWNVERNKRR